MNTGGNTGGGSNWLTGWRESATKSIVNPIILLIGMFVAGIVAVASTGHLTKLSAAIIGVPLFCLTIFFMWAYRHYTKTAPVLLQSENFRLNLAQMQYRQGHGTLPPVPVQDIDLVPTANPVISHKAAPSVTPTDPPVLPVQPERAAGE